MSIFLFLAANFEKVFQKYKYDFNIELSLIHFLGFWMLEIRTYNISARKYNGYNKRPIYQHVQF